MNKQEIKKAIETLKKYHDLLLEVYADYSVHSKAENYSDKSLELVSRANTVKNAVGTAITHMSQQLNNGWIPVSERLPNIGETVLLTVAVNRGISHEYGSVDIAWICDKENKCFYGTDGKYSHDEVIAWQPLPEPYKELATDNNVVTKSGKDNNVLTIGDKIRESNESLVEWYANRVNLYVCGEPVTVNPLNKEKCLNYLNQPYTDTTN